MAFDHKDIDKNNIIEDYLLGNLSDEDETEFEEHLLYCESCREKYRQQEKLLQTMEYSLSKSTEYPSIAPHMKKTTTWMMLSRVAAVIIILSGLAFIFFQIAHRSVHPKTVHIPLPSEAKQDTDIAFIGEQAKTAESDSRQISKKHDSIGETDMLAQVFETMPVFENAVHSVFRSSGVEVINPADSSVYLTGEAIVFNWRTDSKPEAILVIRNNRGEVIATETASPPVRYMLQNPGLYYWQLMLKDESVFTGKLLIFSSSGKGE
ncbi:MAG: zf-HC2 domain-containing protein [Bacteroidales bacterium]|nr:zf-HC2 domain-containing protein [Bacteroidales bacterium]